MGKKKVILALLLVSFIILFVKNLTKEEPKRIKELTYRTGVPVASAGELNPELPRLKKEFLPPKREKFRMGGRGIFEPLKFVRRKPPAPPPPPPAPEPIHEPEPPKETPMEKAVANFTFIGFLESERVKTIFLSRDEEIFIVKEGDKILKEYLVKKITDSNIVISSQNGSEVLDISLVENQPLRKK